MKDDEARMIKNFLMGFGNKKKKSQEEEEKENIRKWMIKNFPELAKPPYYEK